MLLDERGDPGYRQAAGGRVWQWCQRSQRQHLAPAEHRLEALDEALLPRKVPLGWLAIVRPDRCVMTEGPASQAQALLSQALRRLAPAGTAAMEVLSHAV